ncbi:hypothetical protein [Actinomyces sp.]|uniref:hypothetical protein n=1 Tax=Actinomyces sp. TaxID=29317 RepID=UPI0026DCECF4|nr:hypothetical protein [Actinomyces sp.]MDO4899936.1 hypothetical protein [Actinomyces sp.]
MGQARRSARALAIASRADRLAAARAALARAEDHAGLRGREAGRVAHVFAGTERGVRVDGATALAAPVPAPGEPAVDSLLPVGAEAAGVVALTGSVGALLALAALRQSRTGWCGVIGCEGLGWCAAAEAGMDLSRVLAVPAADLPPDLLTAAFGALLDGVSVLLISATAASRLRPRDRRTALARARERHCLILTPFPWEGARVLTASPLRLQAGDDPASGVIPLGSRTQAEGPRELTEGYLQRLTWTLHSPHRPGRVRLVFDAAGAHLTTAAPEAPAVPAPMPRPQLVVVGGADVRESQEKTA